jgi:uncharacterized OB-fold protein
MDKPAPIPTTDTIVFWQGCNEGRLQYQRCAACGQAQFYPRSVCANCQSGSLSTEESGRRGTVHSFTIVHRSANRSFDQDAPFVLALIDLDEGFRMMTNIVGEGRLAASIGAPVNITFEPHAAGQKIPQAVLDKT